MSENLTHGEKLQKLREIVKAVDICMLTIVEHGSLHSRATHIAAISYLQNLH